jgi:hypothetical protein
MGQVRCKKRKRCSASDRGRAEKRQEVAVEEKGEESARDSRVVVQDRRGTGDRGVAVQKTGEWPVQETGEWQCRKR